MTTASDVSLSENSSAHVVFSCTGRLVTFQFYYGDEKVGDPLTVSRADAVRIGKQAEETGTYEQFPISGLSVNDVRTFGLYLRRYGEEGK